MKSSSYKKYRSEQGFSLMIIAGSFMSILAIVGLSFEFSKIAFARRMAQAAADAGAAAASYHIVDLEPKPNAKARIEDVARRVTEDNLARAGISSLIEAPYPKYEFDPATRLVTVEIKISVLTTFLRMVPFIRNTGVQFVSYSHGSVSDAAIGMILDASGSMACPANSGSDCVGSGPTRMQLLKDASKRFIDKFPDYNRISLTAFDGGIVTNVALHRLDYIHPDLRTHRRFLKDTIDALGPRGSTNFEIALRRMRQNFTDAIGANDLPSTAIRKFLFVTDGAPHEHVLDGQQGACPYDPKMGPGDDPDDRPSVPADYKAMDSLKPIYWSDRIRNELKVSIDVVGIGNPSSPNADPNTGPPIFYNWNNIGSRHDPLLMRIAYSQSDYPYVQDPPGIYDDFPATCVTAWESVPADAPIGRFFPMTTAVDIDAVLQSIAQTIVGMLVPCPGGTW